MRTKVQYFLHICKFFTNFVADYENFIHYIGL